nr:hypothetical protein [Tanacetum cinerariifolium]
MSETLQADAPDEKWIPSAERVKISSTNIILETTVPQKEETNSGTPLRRCFDDEIALTFLNDLGYKGSTKQAHQHVYGSYAQAVENSESEPEPKPTKKKTVSRRVVKERVTLSADDNIIFVRKVYATHARIVTESVPESAKKKSDGKSSKSVVIKDTLSAPKSKPATAKSKLKGAPSLTPAEQEATNIIKPGVPDESIVISATSSEGTGAKLGVLDENKDITKEKDGDVDDEGDDHVSNKQDDNDKDDKTKSDEDDIYKYKICLRKDEEVEMKDAEVERSDKGDEEITDAVKEEAERTSKAKVDTKKSELPPSSSSLFVSSGFGDQFLKLSSDSSLVNTVKDSTDEDILVSVIPETTNLPPISKIVTKTPVTTADPSPKVTPIISAVQQKTTPIPTPTITSDALSVINVVPESNALTTVELKVAKLEKDIKKEQAESQKNQQFTIKSTDKAALEEYDLKSALYQSMHANKSFYRIPANHRLYHALMEALIEDENAMNKGVADIVKDHKRKHDNDEDGDDEDPPAGPNQDKKTKRRRTKESESSKKPSFTKETPKGKTLTKCSKNSKSTSVKEPVEEPIAEVIMDDAGDDLVRDDDQPQAASKPKTSKTLNPKWFKQLLRPSTPDPEWNKRQVILVQPAQPWFNQMVSASKDLLTFNDLMATPINFSNIELEYNFQECFNALTDKLDWNNPKGDRYPFDLSKPLPLQGPSVHRTVAADYFFNNDLEYLKTSDPEAILDVKSLSVKKLHIYGHLKEIMVKISDLQLYKFKEGNFADLHLNDIEDMLLLAVQNKLFHLDGDVIVDFIVPLRMSTRSLILKRSIEDLQLGVESYQKKLNITKPQKTFPEIEFKEHYTPSYDPPGIIYEDLNKQKRVLQADELYKFSDGTLKSVCDEIHHRVLDFRLDYNTKMP